ncbi:MAG: hypothetical protein DMF76_18305 [Acidobacteria bacterium]|nr:MAG: hypothetical protein DMF76_18305 [Acidobacteriota bacterium]
MNSRAFISVFVTASILLFPGVTFAKTASCPCSPCKCSPCTCGGGGSKSSGGKHHDRHGHDHGSSFGVGGTVDLGGIGHRTSEPNPFGVGGGEKPVAHTEEKRTTKRKEHEPTGSTFDEIKLTGIEGKGEIAPPGTFNVNNDDEKPPDLPKGEVFTPKTATIDDVKKAHDDYLKAWSDWVKKQPNWNSLVHDWTQSPSTEEGNEKSAKAKKKIDKLNDQFNAGDGKQLVDDWKTKFDNALKSGASVEDNGLVPPAKNDIEKKKYAVITAQNHLNKAKSFYDWKKQSAANQDEEVKKAQDALSNWGATSTNDPKYKAAVAEMKKVHDAEKDLDKAKDAWKPFEKFEEKKAASNP